MLSMDVEGRIGARHITFSLPPVRSVVFVGPNGAGKSSILHMILGLLRPLAGRITLNGYPLFDAAVRVDVPTEERGLGYMPQTYALFPRMTVEDNVSFGLECARPMPGRSERRKRALQVLGELELSHLAKRYPRELSGGEAQRVALARALAPRPKALLLDEPMAALDLASRGHVRRFLASYLAHKGLPTVVVTHDPADAAKLGDHLVILDRGRVVQQGTLTEIKAAAEPGFVAAFVAKAVQEAAGSSNPSDATNAG